MKKVKTFILLFMLITSSLLLLTGCEKRLKMNEEKCKEVALEYLENKYQTEFEVLEVYTIRKGLGSPKGTIYSKVVVNNKYEDTENRYTVIVYPDASSNGDKDGYYDSYKVVSDSYMCYLLRDCTKSNLNKFLTEAGLTRFIIIISIEEMVNIDGFSGFAADFTVQREKNFSLKDLLDKRKITIHCWLDIPESEFSENLQNKIIDIIKPIVSEDDLIIFSMEIYEDEIYDKIEELNKNNIGYDERGKEKISFYVEKENEDEFK